MDIYEQAKKVNADYYDTHTGYIYHITEYNRAVQFGLPTPGIHVSCDGVTIGFAKKNE